MGARLGTTTPRRADDGPSTVTAIVCAYNEAAYIGECLDALTGQTRPADEIIVVDNASTDATGAVAAQRPGVRVVRERTKGLVHARATGARAARSAWLAFVDADCRPVPEWLATLLAVTERRPDIVAASACYRYYDWHRLGRALIRGYDLSVAPLTHFFVQDVLRRGAILYGGNFLVRRSALDAIGGFDTTIAFHGEDTNLGRRLSTVGRVALCREASVATSARRFKAMGTSAVLRLYARNFWSEVLFHRPADTHYEDVRT